DEIGEISMRMQIDLLRVLEDRVFYRVGGTQPIEADFRVIAATNRNLEEAIREERFRKDLYYRLNVITFQMPPLRERKDDILLIAEHFLNRFSQETNKQVDRINREAMDEMMLYDWPGNIRELQNLAERLFTISKSAVIDIEDISTLNIHKRKNNEMTLKEAVDAFEKQCIDEVLELVNGNKTMAAKKLGVHRNTLLAKTNKLQIAR
ncbi:MAG: sigma-54-dependent Fis family transcriptional regulator, partial [Desulfobulbaceae bacterium]|nr:sigma-54-dependent Fis family transcriptional regulator [Desulfobulbaceae bacterium]